MKKGRIEFTDPTFQAQPDALHQAAEALVENVWIGCEYCGCDHNYITDTERLEDLKAALEGKRLPGRINIYGNANTKD